MKRGFTATQQMAALGVVAFIARSRELRLSFEPSGLHIFGSVSGSVILICVMTLGLAIFRSREIKAPSAAVLTVFFRPGGTKTYWFHMAAAILLALSGILEIAQAPFHFVTQPNPMVGPDPAKVVIPVLAGLLSLASGAGLIPVANRNFLGRPKGRFLVPLLLPAFTGCFWLLSTYQRNAANPNIWEYVYQLLGIMCVTLALYYLAASSFDRLRVRPFFLTSGMAVFFCVMLQTEPLMPATRLRYLGMGLFLLVYLVNLEFNIKTGAGAALPDDTSETGVPVADCGMTIDEILGEYKRENDDEK